MLILRRDGLFLYTRLQGSKRANGDSTEAQLQTLAGSTPVERKSTGLGSWSLLRTRKPARADPDPSTSARVGGRVFEAMFRQGLHERAWRYEARTQEVDRSSSHRYRTFHADGRASNHHATTAAWLWCLGTSASAATAPCRDSAQRTDGGTIALRRELVASMSTNEYIDQVLLNVGPRPNRSCAFELSSCQVLRLNRSDAASATCKQRHWRTAISERISVKRLREGHAPANTL